MDLYRGDTFKFEFSATLEDETEYTFKKGETLKAGLKSNIVNSEYQLYQKKIIEEETKTVIFEFSHEEMMKLVPGNKILEVELTNSFGHVSTLYQETINVRGDVINE